MHLPRDWEKKRVPRGVLREPRDFPRTGRVTNGELPEEGCSPFLPFVGEGGLALANTPEGGGAVSRRRLRTSFGEAARLSGGNFATFPTPDDATPAR